MFQKFGLKDVFTGFWRFKWVLILGTLILGGAISAVMYMNHSRSTKDMESVELYCSSASFYFEPVINADGNKSVLITENGTTAESLAETYNVMLDADFCKQYVYDYVRNIYSESELKELTDSKKLDIQSFKKYFQHNILSDNRCLNIFTTSVDQAFSKNLLEAYTSYLDTVVSNQMSNTRMIALGGADQILPLSASNNDIVSGYLDEFTKKDILSVFVVVFGILCIALFVYLFLFPTMNRKTDFSYYDVTLLGEIDIIGKGENING